MMKQQDDFASFLRSLRRRIPRETTNIGSWKRLPMRCGRAVTQEEIAEAVGISRNWYRRLESGDCAHASMKLLARLANACAPNSEDRLQLFVLAIPELNATMSVKHEAKT
jgi:DNA-binding XRE family transcriptional regulator